MGENFSKKVSDSKSPFDAESIHNNLWIFGKNKIFYQNRPATQQLFEPKADGHYIA